MRLFVVTNPELGWNCIIGIFIDKRDAYKRILGEEYNEQFSEQQLDFLLNKTEFIIHSNILS